MKTVFEFFADVKPALSLFICKGSGLGLGQQ